MADQTKNAPDRVRSEAGMNRCVLDDYDEEKTGAYRRRNAMTGETEIFLCIKQDDLISKEISDGDEPGVDHYFIREE